MRGEKTAIRNAIARIDVVPSAQRPIVARSTVKRARVLVAHTLAQQAAFPIADRQTDALDTARARHLPEEFAHVARDRSTVITASHDLSMALR